MAATEQGVAGAALSNLRKSSNSAAKAHPVWYDGRREVHIHPSSINSQLKSFEHPFLVFLEKVCMLRSMDILFYSLIVLVLLLESCEFGHFHYIKLLATYRVTFGLHMR